MTEPNAPPLHERTWLKDLLLSIPPEHHRDFVQRLRFDNVRQMGFALYLLIALGAILAALSPLIIRHAEELPLHKLHLLFIYPIVILGLLVLFLARIQPDSPKETSRRHDVFVVVTSLFIVGWGGVISAILHDFPGGLMPLVIAATAIALLNLVRGWVLAGILAFGLATFFAITSIVSSVGHVMLHAVSVLPVLVLDWTASRFLLNARLQSFLERRQLAGMNRELQEEIRERERIERELRAAQEILEERAHEKDEDLEQAVGRLADSEERYRALFEFANDAIFLMDGEVFVDCNAKTLEMFDCTYEQIVGQPPYLFSPQYQPGDGDSMTLARERIEKAFHGQPQFFEWLHSTYAGDVFHAEVSLNRIDLSDKPHLLAIVRDITDRKEAESALRQSEERLREAQKMEAIGRLAGGVAHDFNNLLTAISGNAELMQINLGEDHHLAHQLDEIRITTERAAKLTRQLLAFGRRQILVTKVLDLNHLLRGMEPMLRRIVGEPVTLALDLEDELPPIKGDATQLERIVVNLVVNARDAMPGGGLLLIATQRDRESEVCRETMSVHDDPGCVVLTVRDTGVGMTEETMQNIFEPFFTTKTNNEGTGLGLATVYGIVKQSGGEIRVDSRLDEGTSFRIWFPGVREKVEVAAAAVEETIEAHGSETILVVEDEEAVRRLTMAALERFGYKTLEAGNGRKALDLCRAMKTPVDLVISDVVMPEMNGTDFARELRELWPEIPILFMSGYLEDAAGRKILRELNATFLQKPFQPLALVRLVRTMLDAVEKS